jgi:hypothetical protein
MPEFMGSRFNQRVGQFDHLSKKKSLSLEFPEAKSQREKTCTLGEPWIVHIFHRMRKATI